MKKKRARAMRHGERTCERARMSGTSRCVNTSWMTSAGITASSFGFGFSVSYEPVVVDVEVKHVLMSHCVKEVDVDDPSSIEDVQSTFFEETAFKGERASETRVRKCLLKPGRGSLRATIDDG